MARRSRAEPDRSDDGATARAPVVRTVMVAMPAAIAVMPTVVMAVSAIVMSPRMMAP